MEYNITTNYKIIQEIKKLKYFKVSLGYTSTIRTKDDKIEFNGKDKFAHFYNTKYNTTIYAQGFIGNINVYCDRYILEDVLAIYYDLEEYIFDFDWKIYKEKGIEWYLGYFLKKIEETLQIENKKTSIKEEVKIVGDPNKVITNPGSVRYEDVKAYIEAKRLGKV